MVAVTLPLACKPLNESSLMYHSTHGLCIHPYIPIIEKPPAVPDFYLDELCHNRSVSRVNLGRVEIQAEMGQEIMRYCSKMQQTHEHWQRR